MGLFDGGDKCVFCGKEQGFLGGLFGINLAGGEYLCGECRDKCAPGEIDFSKLTVDDVREMMEAAKANRRKGQEFEVTRRLSTGRHREEKLIEVDEHHGWFRKAGESDGLVYSLNDIFNFTMNVEMSVLEKDQHFDLSTYEFPELPKCPDGCKVNAGRLVIWFARNELGLDRLELDLIPAFSPDEDDVRGGYACAHEFFEMMRDFRNAPKRRREW